MLMYFLWEYFTKSPVRRSCLSTHCAEENWCEGTVFNFKNLRVVSLFFFLVCFVRFGDLGISVPSGDWVENPYIKKCLLSRNPKFPSCDVQSCFIWCIRSFVQILPVNWLKGGSTRTSFHTSDNRFAVRSRTVLWQSVTKPSFLQDNECSRLNWEPHIHSFRRRLSWCL